MEGGEEETLGLDGEVGHFDDGIVKILDRLQ